MKENKINPDDSPELIEKKKLYTKLCADKKPYFFAYNYTSLKTEYDTFMKNAQSNSVSLYKKDLNTMLEEYENGLLIDEDEIRFIKNFYYKLPLDRSQSIEYAGKLKMSLMELIYSKMLNLIIQF